MLASSETMSLMQVNAVSSAATWSMTSTVLCLDCWYLFGLITNQWQNSVVSSQNGTYRTRHCFKD
nr:hypothetical protein [Providencia stuartii]